MVESAPFPAGGTVGAAEHEQLRRDFAALEDQFGAASEVLEAMGRSAADADTVLTAVVENARRLCRAEAAHLYLLEDGVYRLIKSGRLSEESIRLIAEHPMPMDRDTLIGRVGLDRRTQQIPDVLADPEYGRHDLQRGRRLPHHRGRADDPRRRGRRRPAAVAQRRQPVRRAGDGDRQRLRRRRRRWRSTASSSSSSSRRGTTELARKVDELEALREVGEAVSSSLDVDDVLEHDREARRPAVRDRRRLDHGVRRARALLPRARRLPDRPGGRRAAAVDPDRPRRDARRARRASSAARSPSPTSTPSSSTRTCGSCATPGGARWSPCRCCARTRSSAP